MKLKIQPTPPERLEKEMLRRWPTLNGYTDHMRKVNAWPEWCYLPMSVSLALATHAADEKFAEIYLKNIGTDGVYKLSAIIPWRIEKRIYKFDRTFIRKIQCSDLDASKLALMLMNMPAPCVYISEPPEIKNCLGVFCFLDSQKDRPNVVELRLHYLFNDDSIIAVDAVLNPGRPIVFHVTSEQDKNKGQLCKENALTHTNMLAYICGDNPDIVRVGDRPRIIERGELRVAARPDIFEVGFEIGSTMRKNAVNNITGLK